MSNISDMNVDGSNTMDDNNNSFSDMFADWNLQDQQFPGTFVPVPTFVQQALGPYGQNTPDTSSQSEMGSASIPESLSDAQEIHPIDDLPTSEETFRQVRQIMAGLASQMEAWNQQKAHLLMQGMMYPDSSNDEQVIQAKNNIKQQVARITIEFKKAQKRYEELSELVTHR
ncbi:hypothetical protein BGX31_003027, partial [Mortierella sp. GBA43]